ncbi:MAG: pentapeptide repeat-containing protein, partial [Planctomycetota bacterium]
MSLNETTDLKSGLRAVSSLREQPAAACAVFSHEDCYQLTLKDAQIRRCVFSNVDARKSVILQGQIRRTVFRDCYLHGSRFDGVDLSGSEFWNCNLRYTTFPRCKPIFPIYQTLSGHRTRVRHPIQAKTAYLATVPAHLADLPARRDADLIATCSGTAVLRPLGAAPA